jgi:hypothetical protein
MSSSTSTSDVQRVVLLRLLGAAAAVFALVVAAELVLRALPIAQGVHYRDPAPGAVSARMEANRDYVWSIGWDLRNVVRGRSNSLGFLSPREYAADRPAIALFGDSFAEAQMLEYRESLAGQLEARFDGRLQVFNFGLSGASLPHYLGMARELGSSFQFESAVIVVTPGDFEEGFQEQPGYYRWSNEDLVKLIPAVGADPVRQQLRKLALMRYVRANLKFSPSHLLEIPGQPAACVPLKLDAARQERLARYVDELPKALRLPPEKVVLVFHRHIREIYGRVDRSTHEQVVTCPTRDDLALTELRRLASARGMGVVDASAVLEDHYRVHRRSLAFEPVDSHWNGLATGVIAGSIAAAIRRPAIVSTDCRPSTT